MNLDKLKEAARRHELREEWRKAIEIYQRALADLAGVGEPADPSLFNRIGDLELKAGDAAAALDAYEHAADTYADQGFFNNAIALCGKILRVNPGRTLTFFRLADLHARKNVLGESRRNMQEYVERQLAGQRAEELGSSLRGFAERFGGSAEFRAMVADVLRSAGRNDKSRELCDHLITDLGLTAGGAGHAKPDESERRGAAASGLVFLDTGIDIPGVSLGGPGAGAGADESSAGSSRGGGVAQALTHEAAAPPMVDPLPFIEPTTIGPTTTGLALESLGLSGFEPTQLAPDELYPEPAVPLVFEDRPDLVEIPGLEAIPAFEAPIEGDLGFEPMSLDDDGLISLSDGPGTEPLFDELAVEEDERSGPPAGTIEQLDQALGDAAAESRWDDAVRLMVRLLRLEPDAIPRHQKRVEIAYRSGNRQYLIDAYLSLAQALERIGATENAGLVFERVLEHDPDNPVATAALAALGVSGPAPEPVAPPAAPPPPAAGTPPAEPTPARAAEFVDLGALILDPEPERDTRMRVDQGEPESQEDVDFRETLEQFKQGIAANLDDTDFQAHYDLGIAFKEMGLLDEAIAQFQKALRAPEGRLRASEALGASFFEKGRFAIAEAVLSRAVEALPGADDEKIALIYWLGRALEAQRKGEGAIRCYERALAVDITFLDLGERIQRLTAEKVQ